jgi:SAM-dependent methyltransferase
MRRVGWDIHSGHPGEVFEARGEQQWQFVKSLLPPGWDLGGRQVLDFGCGVGRILRHALTHNPEAAYWGCDVHRPSVDWVRQHLPAANAFDVSEWPPMAQPDAQFDLIYAFSVFTHLVDSWSAWLLELHRVLKDDGVLIVTVFGPGHTAFGDEPVSEEIIGMNVLGPSASWDVGGPLVVHSEWWLRAHWGRAFEIVHLGPGDPPGRPPLYGQGVLVMRKKPGAVTVEELEAYEPNEPRELTALRQNVLSLRREIARHSEVYDTRSWKLTAPLRAAANHLRAARTARR